MFCPKCGSKAEPGVKFCSSCGNALSGQKETAPIEVAKTIPNEVINTSPMENEVVNGEMEAELTAGLAQQAAASTVEASVVEVSSVVRETSATAFDVQKLLKNKVILLPVAVALLALIVFVGIKLIPSSSNHAVLYAKENQLLVKNGKMENSYLATKKIVHDRVFDNSYYSSDDFYTYQMDFMVQQNENGSRIFYMDNMDDDWTATLYTMEPGKLKGSEQDQSVRIASNVSVRGYGPYFTITKKGDQVLYIKDGGNLYLHNLKEEVLIDKNVNSFIALSENETMVLYTKSNDDGETQDLYMKDIKADKEKEKLESDVLAITTYTPNFEKIYFTKLQKSEDDDNNLTLYVKEKGKDKEKLISNFNYLVSSHEDGTVMFVRTNTTEIRLYDLVEDDLLKTDQLIFEPFMSDYERRVPYTDWWGDVYFRTEVDYTAYYNALDKYRAKQNREELRGELKYETVDDITNSLFVFANGEEKKWVDSLGASAFYDAKSQLAIYSKKIDKPMQKLKLSTIHDYFDVTMHYWNSYAYSEELYATINGVETELPNKDLYIRGINLSEDGKKLYWLEGKVDRDSAALVSWDVLGAKLDNKQEIETNVYKYLLIGDKIWYYKDVKNGQGDLFTFANGKKAEMAHDVLVGGSTIYEDGKTILFITDYSDNKQLGTLNMSNGKEKVKIADDVYSYIYWDENNIYYIADYKTRNSKGDLWEYHGANKKKQIDDSVNYVVPLKAGRWF